MYNVIYYTSVCVCVCVSVVTSIVLHQCPLLHCIHTLVMTPTGMGGERGEGERERERAKKEAMKAIREREGHT